MLTDNSLEIRTEADSNDITDCKPSTGMFGFYSYLHFNSEVAYWLSIYTDLDDLVIDYFISQFTGALDSFATKVASSGF